MSEEHKPYDTTGMALEEETTQGTSTDRLEATTDPDMFEGITGVTNSRGSLIETTSYGMPTEDSEDETTTTEMGVKDSITTEGFSQPPVDTENWRPITTTMISANYPKHKHKANKNNNKIDNNYYNVYTNDNINENYDPNIEIGVNHNIEYINGFPTITPEMYGSGSNPYSMPLVSEEIPIQPYPNPVDTERNVGNYLKDYYYEPVPTSIADSIRHSNSHSHNSIRSQRQHRRHRNNSSKTLIDDNYGNRYNRNYHTNDTRLRPTFNKPLKNKPVHRFPMSDMEQIREALVPKDNSFFDYHLQNHDNSLNYIPKGRPLFGLIGDDTKNVEKVKKTPEFESVRNRKTSSRYTNNMLNNGNSGARKPQDTFIPNEHLIASQNQINASPQPFVDVKPIKINTKVCEPQI